MSRIRGKDTTPEKAVRSATATWCSRVHAQSEHRQWRGWWTLRGTSGSGRRGAPHRPRVRPELLEGSACDLHRAVRCLCLPALSPLCRTGSPPGQPRRPPARRLSWGQDNPEPNVVVPVRWVVVVALRRPAVVRVVVPISARAYAVRARIPGAPEWGHEVRPPLARGPPARFGLPYRFGYHPASQA